MLGLGFLIVETYSNFYEGVVQQYEYFQRVKSENCSLSYGLSLAKKTGVVVLTKKSVAYVRWGIR